MSLAEPKGQAETQRSKPKMGLSSPEEEAREMAIVSEEISKARRRMFIGDFLLLAITGSRQLGISCSGTMSHYSAGTTFRDHRRGSRGLRCAFSFTSLLLLHLVFDCSTLFRLESVYLLVRRWSNRGRHQILLDGCAPAGGLFHPEPRSGSDPFRVLGVVVAYE